MQEDDLQCGSQFGVHADAVSHSPIRADDADPEQVLTEDDYGDLYAYRLSVRGKE